MYPLVRVYVGRWRNKLTHAHWFGLRARTKRHRLRVIVRVVFMTGSQPWLVLARFGEHSHGFTETSLENSQKRILLEGTISKDRESRAILHASRPLMAGSFLVRTSK